MKLIFFVNIIFLFNSVASTELPLPGDPQSQAILLKGGRLHLGNGMILEKGDLRFEKGRITAVDTNLTPRPQDLVLEVSGNDVYPSLIAPDTQLGLTEVGAVRASVDHSEVGSFSPNVQAYTAYNVDSSLIPVVRSNGVSIAEVAPLGGKVAGLASLFKLDAWTKQEAVVAKNHSMYFNWQKGDLEKFNKFVEKTKSYMKWSDQLKKNKPNLKAEAMVQVLNKKVKAIIRTQSSEAILEILKFQQMHNLDLVIKASHALFTTLDQVKAAGVPVIVDILHDGLLREDQAIDELFSLPTKLNQKGILFALASDTFAAHERNLPFLVGTAVSYGLDYNEAVKAVTLNTAQILGVDKVMGSLEVGKQANIIVSEGDLFEMLSSKVILSFIQGSLIDLTDKQKQLFQKYTKRPRKKSRDLL